MNARCTALALLCMPAWVLAQSADVAAPVSASHDLLYQQALQSLAEGRRTDASRTLEDLIEQAPQHAGALIDLALIQCGLGNGAQAERLFATIETRFAPTREILELINDARDSGCKPLAATSTFSVSVGRGHDDNVNQGASNATFVLTTEDGDVELPLLDEFLPKRDNYTVMGADYVRSLGANGSIGFVQFQQRRYDTMRSYDTGALFGGIESPWRLGTWTVRTTGSLGVTSMGGRLYQQQAQAQARVTPPLPLSADTQLHLVGAATHTEYRTLRAFDSDLFEVRALLAHQAGSLAANATLGLLSDHARGDRPGGNRHGNFVTLALRKPLGMDISGELSWTHQRWDSAAPYSPELLIDQVRAQRTKVLRATLTYQVGKNHALMLEGRHVRNRENVSFFQYDNRQLQLSWQWHYP